LLSSNLSSVKEISLTKESGIGPVRKLENRVRAASLVMLPIDEGMEPVRELERR
jgi:hypothetical protein